MNEWNCRPVNSLNYHGRLSLSAGWSFCTALPLPFETDDVKARSAICASSSEDMIDACVEETNSRNQDASSASIKNCLALFGLHLSGDMRDLSQREPYFADARAIHR